MGKVASSPSSPVTDCVGKSIVIESPAEITRVSLANPDVADALVLSPRQVVQRVLTEQVLVHGVLR